MAISETNNLHKPNKGDMMNSKVLRLIEANGCHIRLDVDLKTANFLLWQEVYWRKAYGLFSPAICKSSIFLFDAICPSDSTDYVLAHEFGHFMSCKLSLGIHELNEKNNTQVIKENYRSLMIEEEYRADTFAVALSSKILFEIPTWVKVNRVDDYPMYIPLQRRAELDIEVHYMLSKALHYWERAS